MLAPACRAGVVTARAAAAPAQQQTGLRLVMSTGQSQLFIGSYPPFSYNATGGGGETAAAVSGSRVSARFDAATLRIPPLDASTAVFLGVPLLPVFKVAIQPISFEGWIDRETGEAAFDFRADFLFSAANLYRAPPLNVLTKLTTEAAQGEVLGGHGERLNGSNSGKLVGVAALERTRDPVLNTFLGLPTDCKALMGVHFEYLL